MEKPGPRRARTFVTGRSQAEPEGGLARVMLWPNLARGEGAALTPRGALPDGLAERLQPHDAHHNEPEAGDPRGRRGLAEHQHPDDCRADGADAGPDRVRGA